MPATDSTTLWIQQRLDQIAAGQDHTIVRDELLSRASRRIHILVRSAMRTRPELGRWETDEDVLQEVLIRLDRAVQDTKPEHLGQFFIIVGQHIRWATLSLIRHHFGPHGQGKHHQTGAFSGAGGELLPGSQPARNDALSRLDLIKLHEAVEVLDADERNAWHLCRYLGMTHKLAAEQLDVSTKTIQRRLDRAKIKLAAELDSLNPDQ